MNFWATIRIAFHALGRNKLRSALTLLGIVMGVGAVIAMVSLGQGAQRMIETQIQSIGTNLLFVTPGSQNRGGAQLGAATVSTLDDQDVEAIQKECPSVVAATPMVNVRGQIIFGDANWNPQIVGTSESAPVVRNWDIARGDFFTEADVRSASRVVVLGKTVVDKLFAGNDPVGTIVRVNNLAFRIVGELAPKGQSMMGQDQDDIAVIPYTTAQKKLRHMVIPAVDNAMVSTASPAASHSAQQEITDLLRQRHNLREGDPDDFQVRNLSDIASTAEAITMLLTIFLGSIAAISLIVGGIGIMNIMLVSVTERTREIGIRRAVGARAGHIRLQFLSESVSLSLIGGLIGVVLGGGGALAISHFLGWPAFVSPLAIGVSFAFSAGVGIFFGYYPAHRAASLDPIEALRYE